MSKTLSVALAAHYAGGATTLAKLWKITRRDGLVFGFTDHDDAITYLGVAYEPSSVFDASAVATSAELNVDNMEMRGLLDSYGITADAMESGVWDGATVRILEVNYRDLTMGHNPLRYGVMGEIQRSGKVYTAEARGLLHKLQNNIGRIVKPSCPHVLGSAQCGVNLEALRVAGEVTAASTNSLFTTNLGGGVMEGSPSGVATYAYGVLTWTTGNNDGRSMEVKAHTATGVLELQLAMPYAVQVGDDFTITPGCDKRKVTCIAVFDNLVNPVAGGFGGFSFVPGQDRVLLVGGQ